MIDLVKIMEDLASTGREKQPGTPAEILAHLAYVGQVQPWYVRMMVFEFCRIAGLKRVVNSLKANGMDAAAMLVEMTEVEL